MGSLEDILIEILAFRREHPAAAAFSDALDQTARRIQREFAGATREALLAEVGATLERQARVSRDTRAALAAVDELAAALQRFATLIDRTVRRPPGTTLH